MSRSQFSPKHSEIFNSLNVSTYDVSDFIYNSKRIEIKETYNSKKGFTIHKKDVLSHDYFIFYDKSTQIFYLLDANDIDTECLTRNFKDSTRFYYSFIAKHKIVSSSDLQKVLACIN